MTTLTHDQITYQQAISTAARFGLHDGMAVYATNSQGTRYGRVEVCTHPQHLVVIRTNDGETYEVLDESHCPWRPASRESLGPSDFEACVLAADACRARAQG